MEKITSLIDNNRYNALKTAHKILDTQYDLNCKLSDMIGIKNGTNDEGLNALETINNDIIASQFVIGKIIREYEKISDNTIVSAEFID
jgi:hypothetical protein